MLGGKAARVADSICECVRGFLRGLEVAVALAIGGGRQAQEASARHAATADAARAEHESGGAAGPGVLGCDVRGGTSACVGDTACGFGPWARVVLRGLEGRVPLATGVACGCTVNTPGGRRRQTPRAASARTWP